MNDYGSRLKAIREEKGLSLRYVSQLVGTSDTTLSNLENNITKNPSPLILKSLASIYELNVIPMYLAYGYLDESDLKEYQQVFSGLDNLTERQICVIQQLVNVINN